MSVTAQKVTPMLWFDGQAEEAARLYVSVFEDAELGDISRLPDGSPLVVEFTLAGQRFTALNGGPQYTFSPGRVVRGRLRDAGGGRPLLGQARPRAATRRRSSAAGSRTGSASRGRSCRGSSPSTWATPTRRRQGARCRRCCR